MATMLFDLYRYQIIPTQDQLNLLYDLNKLIEKKNDLFEEALKNLKTIHNNQFQFVIERQLPHKFVALVSKQKKVSYYTPEHEKSQIPSFPPAHIVIDNDKEYQLILIERNYHYQNSHTLVKRFLKSINPLLAENHLLLKIAPIYQAKSFWAYVDTHKEQIQKVKFLLITPNMSNISQTLSEQIRENAKMTKAAETEFCIKADGQSHLVIDKDNQQLAGMVDYTAEGGGETIITLKDVKAKYKSNDYQSHLEIGEIEFKTHLPNVFEEVRRAASGENR